MIYDILYEASAWHTRVALFDDVGRLLSVHYDDDAMPFLEGAAILGRVRKISEGLNAAFVDIGDVEDAFLPLNKLPKGQPKLVEGQELMVRVTRSKADKKAVRLSGRVMEEKPAGAKAPCLVKKADGALNRAIQDAGVNPIRVWIVDGRARADVLPVVSDAKLFQLDQHDDVDLLESLDNQLESLGVGTFHLPGGGQLHIEMTKALTSIDVDSGDLRGKNRDDAVLTMNLKAAEEIVRLCRLLDLGGSIIIDFITMSRKGDRRQVQEHMQEAFAQMDSRPIEILAMSRFGLMELNRKKTGESLLRTLRWPAFIAGDLLLKLWRYKPGQHDFHLEVSSDIAPILKDRLTKEAAQAYLGGNVVIEGRTDFKLNEYQLSANARIR